MSMNCFFVKYSLANELNKDTSIARQVNRKLQISVVDRWLVVRSSSSRGNLLKGDIFRLTPGRCPRRKMVVSQGGFGVGCKWRCKKKFYHQSL